jgi:signal transduction histidine kinase
VPTSRRWSHHSLAGPTTAASRRTGALFAQFQLEIHKRTDRLSAGLMAFHAESDCLASMSHELRTPLNAIILYSVLSAHAMTTDRDVALAAGGDDFDTKPIQFERLIEKIEMLLPKAALR